MSMLQAQCDELRELAGDGSMEFVSGPIRASVLREAADTIWELRGSVHRERAEADRLREELDRMTEAVEALHSAPLEDQLVQALNDADRLREKAGNLLNAVIAKNNELLDLLCENEKLRNQLRELEIEV